MDTSTERDPGLIDILVVDHDEVDRGVVRRHLSACGLSVAVEETSDPAVVMSKARSGAYHCILMDYRFPTGTAFELFDELLAEPCSHRPPIVLLTGTGNERVAAESIQRGAQEYLTKADVSPDAIRLAIESALGKARHQRELEQRDEELRRMSFYDPLTKLPNRRLFMDRLEQAVRHAERLGGSFAVLMMDLDLFKNVNDMYGHEAGDRLLEQVGERLGGVVRGSDTVARLGGDEFAALLSTADSLEGAMIVAEKISAVIAEPFLVQEHVAYIGVSIGIAQRPAHGTTAERLLRHADKALYESKRTHAGISVYGTSRSGAGHEAALIAQGLKGALAENELFTMYQPQVRLEDGSVMGVEALVRWRHPQLGLLPATKFVPAAERSDVIEGLTHRVLSLALAQGRAWREHGIDLPIAVNLSARLLDREGLVDRIQAQVTDAGVHPSALCLEVTETGIMHSPETAGRTLSALSALGIRISIDDFGTGYSSLRYLRTFPIDEIKIDGSFVAGLSGDHRDGLIVESVLALGKAFGVRVLAEGIEDDAAWGILRGLGCRYGQGYRFGPAMSALAFERWYRSWDGGEIPDRATMRRSG